MLFRSIKLKLVTFPYVSLLLILSRSFPDISWRIIQRPVFVFFTRNVQKPRWTLLLANPALLAKSGVVFWNPRPPKPKEQNIGKYFDFGESWVTIT